MTDSQRSHHVRVDFAEGILESEGLGFRHRFGTVGEKRVDDALAGRLELGRWDHFVHKPDTPCFLGGEPFSRQRIAAKLAGAAAWWMLERTRQGKLLRVVIHDREVSAALGINVARMFTVTFVIGAILGALGGALTAPGISVVPGVGVDVIVLAFAVSVIGGLGSIAGAAIGALIVGIARAAAVHLMPEIELFVIYAVMAAVLAVRPQGLFGRAAARKI